MENLNKQFEKITAIQAEAFEPVRAFGGIAADTFERVARQNYAVIGDYVEFAVGQAKLTTEAKDPTDYMGKQIEAVNAFGAQLMERVNQYMTIAQTAQNQVQETALDQTAEKQAA